MKVFFAWDEAKERENRRKHGVPFFLAQYAFLDPKRIIASDAVHSETEERYFCIGRVEGKIVTVRFTYRGNVIRISAPGIGEKEGYYMKNKTKYSDEPEGYLKMVKDFLPPPDQLVLKEDNVKITLSLNRESVDFLKKKPKSNVSLIKR